MLCLTFFGWGVLVGIVVGIWATSDELQPNREWVSLWEKVNQ